MSTTFHLRVWTRYNDPVSKVWAVKTDPKNLRGEFPFWLPFRVEDEAGLSAAFAAGRPFETAGKVGLLGIAWPVRLESVEPGRRFRDSSTNALFSRFEHEHIFEETRDGARYVDAVTFTPCVPAPKMVAILLKQFFVARHRAASRLLSPDRLTIGTHVLRVLIEEEQDADGAEGEAST